MALRLPRLRINKTWLMLIVAIGLALLATMMTTRYLKSREASIAAEMRASAQQGGAKVAVVVPTRDLPAGTPLGENLVASREIAADLVYPNAIFVDDFDSYKGQNLIRPVLQGRPLLKTDLHVLHADFAGTLAEGTRAITIDVDELNSVAHMVQPGNRVDLMLSMKSDDGQTVFPFMDNMKVLATGQRLMQDAGENSPGSKKSFSYANLTLEVTPIQAGRLTLAQDLGKLRFVLRNEKDQQHADFSVNAQNIFDEVAARSSSSKSTRTSASSTSHSRASDGSSIEYIIGGQRMGSDPSARSVAVPVSGLDAPLMPPAGASTDTITDPGLRIGKNALTPEMKSELKKLIEQ